MTHKVCNRDANEKEWLEKTCCTVRTAHVFVSELTIIEKLPKPHAFAQGNLFPVVGRIPTSRLPASMVEECVKSSEILCRRIAASANVRRREEEIARLKHLTTELAAAGVYDPCGALAHDRVAPPSPSSHGPCDLASSTQQASLSSTRSRACAASASATLGTGHVRTRSAQKLPQQDRICPVPFTRENFLLAIATAEPVVFEVDQVPSVASIKNTLRTDQTAYRTTTSSRMRFERVFHDPNGIHRIEEGVHEHPWQQGRAQDIIDADFPTS